MTNRTIPSPLTNRDFPETSIDCPEETPVTPPTVISGGFDTAGYFVTSTQVTDIFVGFDTHNNLLTSAEGSGPFESYMTGTAFV